jgi:hypothetical protein
MHGCEGVYTMCVGKHEKEKQWLCGQCCICTLAALRALQMVRNE